MRKCFDITTPTLSVQIAPPPTQSLCTKERAFVYYLFRKLDKVFLEKEKKSFFSAISSTSSCVERNLFHYRESDKEHIKKSDIYHLKRKRRRRRKKGIDFYLYEK